MLKNNGKIAISQNLIFGLCIICLIFTSFGFCVENSFAVDLNESINEIAIEDNIEDKIVNSQDLEVDKLTSQENEIMEVDSRDDALNSNDEKDESLKMDDENSNEILAVNRNVIGNTFDDIQTAINGAQIGDTIVLNGTYISKGTKTWITVDKQLTITSSSPTVLDAQGLSSGFILQKNAARSVIKNLKFINCDGGRSTAIRVNATDVTVDNCVFDNNLCKLGGIVGTEYDLYLAKNFKIQNCNFTNNKAYYMVEDDGASAAGLAVFSTDSRIVNCIFDSNWATGLGDSYGGALQTGMDSKDSRVMVLNCTFRNNGVTCKGTSHGGASCVREGTDYVKCIFINNSADMGGALTFHSSGNLVDCIFINNTASKLYGGAISTGYKYGIINDMKMGILNCYFEGNNAPEGGAIQAKGTNVDILDSTFKKNHVTQYGGAISIDAINVTVINSNFDSNVAEVDGGAIYIKGSNTIVQKSSFNSNHAIPDVKKLNDGLGGAIYVDSELALLKDNLFELNTARNGSAIYYDKNGKQLTLINNELHQNQAWVYGLPISAHDIFHTEGDEEIKVVLYGGNNIARYNNLDVSNAIYNAADNSKIVIDGMFPLSGATNSGELYQDDREYNMEILLTVQHEDGTIVYNNSLNTSYLGEIDVKLSNLKVGKYFVTAKHIEDTYYKEITNITTFNVIPKVDNKIIKSVNRNVCDFEDIIIWTLTISNDGPSNSTNVTICDVLPDGLILFNDTTGKKYNPETGILFIPNLNVGEKLVYEFFTIIDKTGEIVNRANITSNELDSNMSNNYDEVSIFVNPAADLSVQKSVNNSSPNYGDIIQWKIVVMNNGPDAANNVTVTDLLPKSLEYIESDGFYTPSSGIWTIGTLENGAKRELNILCKINSTGLIQNDVSVKGDIYDHDPSNNNDSQLIFIDSASDLSITKSANVSEINYGDFVKWTLVISNKGPNSASEVEVRDVLPEAFKYVSSTSSKGNYSNGIFNIGDLSVGEIVTIDIISKAIATGNHTNVAKVTSGNYDVNLTNNMDDESIYIKSASDLAVVKSVNNENPDYGDLIQWVIVVTNNGPDIAYDILVNDILDESLEFEDCNLDNYDYDSGELNIDQLNVGESITLTINCFVKSTGIIQNNVSVSSDAFDYNLTNNNDTSIIYVEKSVDVSVVKFVDNDSPNYGDIIKWTLMASNNGPDKATDVYVEETLPKGLKLINYTATKGFYDNGLWALCCLNEGDIETLEITCQVIGTGKITNAVTIHSNETDSNLTNNGAEKSIEVPLTVDLEVIKKASKVNPFIGEIFTWIISVKNNGPDIASNVILNENLPGELIFSGYKSTKGTYSNGQWNIGSLNVGETEYLNISCVSNAVGEIINNVEVHSMEHDLDESNNLDESKIDVLPLVDLSVTKSVNATILNYGDLVKWTLSAFNNGPNKATNVLVYDKIPDGLDIVNYNSDYRDGVWNIGNLNVGETRLLEIICKVTKTGELVNNVKINASESDLDLTNNFDEKSIFVNPASDLQITKITSKYYYFVGDVIEYVITVVNNGPDNAFNVKIEEILDESLNIRSFEVSDGKFNKFSGIWSLDMLENGKSAKLSIKAIAVDEGVFENLVSVSSDSFDYDLSNNNDTALVDVVEKVINSSSKPTNNQNKNSEKSNKSSNKNGNDLLNDKRISELIKDGSLAKLLKNKNFLDLIKGGSFIKLLNNKNFLDLVRSGFLAKLLKNKNFLDLVRGGYLDKLLKNKNFLDLVKDGTLGNLLKNRYLLENYLNMLSKDDYLNNSIFGGNMGIDSSVNDCSINNLQKYSTANPFVLLLVSLMFSVMSFRRYIFK